MSTEATCAAAGARLRAALRARSDRHFYRAHPAVVRGPLDDPGAVVAGASQAPGAGPDLVVTEELPEVYVQPDDLPRLVRALTARSRWARHRTGPTY